MSKGKVFREEERSNPRTMTNEGEESEVGRDEANDGLVSSARSLPFPTHKTDTVPKAVRNLPDANLSRNGIDRAVVGVHTFNSGFRL